MPDRAGIAEIYKEMSDYMRDMGAGEALIDVTMSTPPEQMHVISRTEIDRLIPYMDPVSEAMSVWRNSRSYGLAMEEYRNRQAIIDSYGGPEVTEDFKPTDDKRLCELIDRIDKFASWHECHQSYLWGIDNIRVFRARDAEARAQCAVTREQEIESKSVRKNHYKSVVDQGGYLPMIEVPDYSNSVTRDCYIRIMQGRVPGFRFDYLD